MDETIFEESNAVILDLEYSIYNCKKDKLNNISYLDIFAIVQEEDYLTVISSKEIENYTKISNGWKIITISINAPPSSVGVASIITSKFSSNNISIVPIASFNKANLLVQEKDIFESVNCLKELGIKSISIEGTRI